MLCSTKPLPYKPACTLSTPTRLRQTRHVPAIRLSLVCSSGNKHTPQNMCCGLFLALPAAAIAFVAGYFCPRQDALLLGAGQLLLGNSLGPVAEAAGSLAQPIMMVASGYLSKKLCTCSCTGRTVSLRPATAVRFNCMLSGLVYLAACIFTLYCQCIRNPLHVLFT